MRAVRREWRSLRRRWRAGLARLPFFTQRTAVLLVGVLVAALAMLGGVVALVGWPGAGGPNHLVPGERAGRAPESRPGPGTAAPGARPGAGDRSGADAGGAASASPSPGAARPTPAAPAAGRAARGSSQPGAAAAGAQGSGGAAGAGAGGPPAAPPTTSPPTTTTGQGPLDPVDDLLGPVVSTLLP